MYAIYRERGDGYSPFASLPAFKWRIFGFCCHIDAAGNRKRIASQIGYHFIVDARRIAA